jgi:hypothetical protein
MNTETITARVREALEDLGTDYPMEDVVKLCPGLTWNQVFLAIDHLSRTGLIRVTLDSTRNYRVRALQAHKPVSSAAF